MNKIPNQKLINILLENYKAGNFNKVEKLAKSLIKDFPEHEKTMKKWTSIAAKRHLQFEKAVKAKERHLLNLDELVSSGTSLSSDQSENAVDQLKKLNDLYKSGVLTKDEFEKAKKKILN